MLFVLQTRKTYPGFQLWAMASFLGFFGFILLSLQGLFPEFFTVLVANTFLIGAAFVVAYGLEVFAGKSPSGGRIWSVVFMHGVVHFNYFFPNVMARVITISILYLLIFGVCAFLVYRDIPLLLQSSNWLLVMIFSSLACLNVLRIVGTMLFEFDTKNFLAPSVIQGMTFMGGLVRNHFNLCGFK